MARMVSPDGREAEIVADGVDAMGELGWEVVEADESKDESGTPKRSPRRTSSSAEK